MRSSPLLLGAVAALVSPLAAQYSTDFEALNASAAGTIITNQDGYYVPVAGSLDGLVVTYAGNTLGVPANPNGGNNFYAGISQATNVFARAQRTIPLPTSGLVYVQFDVCCNYLSTGTPANNIGSFSFQPSTNSTYVNLLARWPTGATAPPPTWDADVVAGTGTLGTTTTVSLADPAFQGLPVNVWHTWGTTVDLVNGVHVDFRITNGATNQTTVHVPATPLLLPVAGAPLLPTDFRLFTGGSDNLFAVDNLIIDIGGSYEAYGSGCPGSLGVPTLAAAAGSRPVIGTTFTAELSNLPLGLGVLATGFSDTLAFGSIALPYNLAGNGFPGCTLLADPLASQFLIATGTTAAWNFAIPNNPAYVGVTMFQQGISLDSVGPGGTFSNGARLRVGR